ncbi:MAG: ATP-binding cassette domain-containing protein [Candidatus Omnitrophica bacterium]|nr:ATP-binding cassette domain-containing protein [Candidatus Omnitrophota bacterium]
MNDILISAKNVGKKFSKSLKRSMFYGVTDVMMNAVGIECKSENLRAGEFWAVDDVSFELKKGETLGIIGPNGSGKSTFLKMLNGIYMPDKGRIEMQGRVGALIEVGAGFHPMLSGRENIYINGTILGMTKREIDEKFDEIVEFADIGDFIDSPVKYYSSGMYVRLGLSIAININPEILLIDEVLSVGDLSFQNKSLRKLAALRDNAHAVVFVSHNLRHVSDLCDRVIILNAGRQEFTGDPKTAIIKYEKLSRKISLHAAHKNNSDGIDLRISSGEEIEYVDCGLLDVSGRKTSRVSIDEPLIQFCDFILNNDVAGLYFSISIYDQHKRPCLWSVSSDMEDCKFDDFKKGKYRIIVRYESHCLMPGIYLPSIAIRNNSTGETYERILLKDSIEIVGEMPSRGIVNTEKEWSLIEL